MKALSRGNKCQCKGYYSDKLYHSERYCGNKELLTREFVKRWNEKNGYEDGINLSTNMRYVRDGVVSWNQYDAEELDIEQFVNIYKEITTLP